MNSNASERLGYRKITQSVFRRLYSLFPTPARSAGSRAHVDHQSDLMPLDARIQIARNARAGGDKIESLRNWEIVLKAWPGESIGHCGVAALARETGNLSHAAEVIENALSLFPDDPAVVSEAAWIAVYKGEWPARVVILEELAASAPAQRERPLPALSEMMDWILESDHAQHFRGSAKFRDACIQRARDAQAKGDEIEALGRWEFVSRQWPDESAGYCGASALARETGQLSLAAEIAERAVERFPNDPAVVREAAWIPFYKGDWPARLAIWRDIAAAESARSGAPLPPLSALLDWVLASENVRHFRDDAKFREACMQRARDAEAASDAGEALDKWELVLREWPEKSAGYCRVSALAKQKGDLGYASKVIESALSRFPDDPAVLSSAAWIARAKDDWTLSLALWEKLISRGDPQLDWLKAYGDALIVLGRFDEADSFLRDARTRFPQYDGFVALQAFLADARQNVDESLALWAEFRRMSPDAQMGWEFYGRLTQAKLFERLEGREGGGGRPSAEAVPVAPATRAELDVLKDDETRELLLNFESMGRNCELGLLQRRFGAEPLGLLRFNFVPLPGLLSALEHRFADMGAPETTEMYLTGGDAGEYIIRDRRWGIGMHTFVMKGHQAPEILYAKFRKRVVYLREKFMTDLQEREKIFVYTSDSLNNYELSSLYRAARSIAKVTLLHVKPAPANPSDRDFDRPGEVRKIDDGLFVGALSRLGYNPDGSWSFAFDDWLSVCRRLRAEVNPEFATTAP